MAFEDWRLRVALRAVVGAASFGVGFWIVGYVLPKDWVLAVNLWIGW